MKKIVVALLLAVTTITFGQEKVLLQLNYAKGDVYETNVKLSQDMGAVMSVKTEITTLQEITNISENTYESDSKITKIKMGMLQGGVAMSYDSSEKNENLDPASQMLKSQIEPILKAVISVKGNNLGEILESKITPEIPGANQFTQQSSNVVFPKNKIAVGDTWSMTKEEQGMKFNFMYKLATITAENVTLNVSGTVEGMAAGDIKGAMKIDKKSGIPLNSKIEMKMKVQGQNLTTTVNSTTVKK